MEHHGASHLYRNLTATDRRAAKLEAETWENALRLQWAAMTGAGTVSRDALRQIYEDARQLAEAGELLLHSDPNGDPVADGIEYELDKLADSIGRRKLREDEAAKVAGLQDALRTVRRQPVEPRREYEPTFRELAEEHLRLWRIAPGRKETNTEQQKVATFDLFASYFGDRPLRMVRRADASAFVDALRQLDPNWARTGKAKADTKPMTWAELQRAFGGREKGLSDATVNRHMATLTALWSWAETREYCQGSSPFQGHRRKLQQGRNKQSYVAWTPEELERLFSPPPAREDLTEVMLVGMFTGMRINEIVSLTCGQIITEEGVTCIDITKAKSLAGVRKVPLHPRLAWVAAKAKAGKADDRLWPKFTPEGPGAKPGGDAGKEFSRFKLGLGYADRRKVFHSFRKNVVGQLERARVPESEVAQIVGHEKKGITFGIYGARLPLPELAQIVALIDYPGLKLPK